VNETLPRDVEYSFDCRMDAAGLSVPTAWRSEVLSEYVLLLREIAVVHGVTRRAAMVAHPFDNITTNRSET